MFKKVLVWNQLDEILLTCTHSNRVRHHTEIVDMFVQESISWEHTFPLSRSYWYMTFKTGRAVHKI